MILKRDPHLNIILCGDFNLDILTKNSESREFLCLLRSFNMQPYIDEPTRITNHSATCIDNIISNLPRFNVNVIELSLSDHTLQYASFELLLDTERKDYFKYIRLTSETNISQLAHYLMPLQWEKNLISNCEDNFNNFHDLVLNAFDRFCPFRKVKNYISKKLKWVTKGIKISCQTKRELFILTKLMPNNVVIINYYRKYCNILKKMC